MMVMPLGPDFAEALAIPTSQIGRISSSYAAAAALAGLVGAVFLNRFDRRKALCTALVGLAIGTAAGGFAFDLASLMSARALAGMFGGPATALSIAVISDTVPPERRGKAMGKAMSAFTIASVLGIPFGLRLSRIATYRAPFFAVALLCLAITFAAYTLLPPLTVHLTRARDSVAAKAPFFTREIVLMLVSAAFVMAGNFALVPNFSAYLQYNLGYPRERLELVYVFGGLAAFVVTRTVGRFVDRVGATRSLAGGTVLYVTVLVVFLIRPLFALPPLLIFVSFMATNASRFVPMQTLASRVPTIDRRARFLSAQSAVQHFASSIGSSTSSIVLTADAQHRLVGFSGSRWSPPCSLSRCRSSRSSSAHGTRARGGRGRTARGAGVSNLDRSSSMRIDAAIFAARSRALSTSSPPAMHTARRRLPSQIGLPNRRTCDSATASAPSTPSKRGTPVPSPSSGTDAAAGTSAHRWARESEDRRARGGRTRSCSGCRA